MCDRGFSSKWQRYFVGLSFGWVCQFFQTGFQIISVKPREFYIEELEFDVAHERSRLHAMLSTHGFGVAAVRFPVALYIDRRRLHAESLRPNRSARIFEYFQIDMYGCSDIAIHRRFDRCHYLPSRCISGRLLHAIDKNCNNRKPNNKKDEFINNALFLF